MFYTRHFIFFNHKCFQNNKQDIQVIKTMLGNVNRTSRNIYVGWSPLILASIHVNCHVTDGACWRGGKCNRRQHRTRPGLTCLRGLCLFHLVRESDLQVPFNAMFSPSDKNEEIKLITRLSNATKNNPKHILQSFWTVQCAFIKGFSL